MCHNSASLLISHDVWNWDVYRLCISFCIEHVYVPSRIQLTVARRRKIIHAWCANSHIGGLI